MLKNPLYVKINPLYRAKNPLYDDPLHRPIFEGILTLYIGDPLHSKNKTLYITLCRVSFVCCVFCDKFIDDIYQEHGPVQLKNQG